MLSDLPEEPKALTEWVERRWVEKDELLKEMRASWTDAEGLRVGTMGGVRRWRWFGRDTSSAGKKIE